MKLLILFVVLYVSPGCLSQCANCAPQPTYQYVLNVPTNYVQVPSGVSSFLPNRSPCCVPTSNVQTIQSARAFTNGAQGSQVIMYYNGQRVVSNNGQQQQVSGFNQNPLNNYQNPGPIPAPTYQNGYQGDQNQTQQGYYTDASTDQPNNLNGGVAVAGVGQNQQQGQNVGGNIGNQGGFVDNQGQNINVGGNINNQGQSINAGGIVGNPNQYQDQTQYGNNPYDNQNYQGSTLNPSGGEVSYQPFVPSGNTDYNSQGGQYDQQQSQQGQQGSFQQNQNNQNVIYPAGGVVTGGSVAGSSYNSPNSGYVNSQVQPQTYPTQVVTGGAINSQNVQQQPNVNTQYQDQTQNANGAAISQNNQQNAGRQGSPGGGFTGPQGTTTQNSQGTRGFTNAPSPSEQQTFSTASGNQQQGITNAPQGQNQQSTGNGQFGVVGNQQGYTNVPGNQQQTGSQYQNQNQNQGFTSTPGYQQGELTEGSGFEENEFTGSQQQFTTPSSQQGSTNGQQGYFDSTLTSVLFNNDPSPQNETTQSQTQQTSGSTTQSPFNTQQMTSQPMIPSSSQSPYPVIFPVPSAGQQITTTVAPFPQTTVSSNQDEFGAYTYSQNDAVSDSQPSSTQSSSIVPVPVPVPVPVLIPQNNGNVTLVTTTTISTQNGSGFESTPQVTGYAQQTTAGPYLIGGGVQGQSSTNSYQSTTPTANYNGNGATTRGQQQSSTGFQATTGMPVTNDNQSGFVSSSTVNPNMPQAQYPSQQEILASTGQTTTNTGGSIGISTQAPQYPSQQELGAVSSSTQQTPTPQFPAQQDLGATTSSSFINGDSSNGVNTIQQTTGATPQFPSQQELLQRDQQSVGSSGSLNANGFTPQYGDMNTPYGHYASSTVKASSNPQFDQPTADQQQPENSAERSFNSLIAMFLMVFML